MAGLPMCQVGRGDSYGWRLLVRDASTLLLDTAASVPVGVRDCLARCSLQ